MATCAGGDLVAACVAGTAFGITFRGRISAPPTFQIALASVGYPSTVNWTNLPMKFDPDGCSTNKLYAPSAIVPDIISLSPIQAVMVPDLTGSLFGPSVTAPASPMNR